jgi:hypothetical protein
MALRIRDVINYQELKQLVEASFEQYDDPYFTPDKSYALKMIFQAHQNGGMVRVIENNEGIIAYGLAVATYPVMHSKVKCLSQQYYHSVVSGFTAVRALELFHDEMILFARTEGIRYCMSTSVLPNHSLFCTILRRKGWKQRGLAMIYPVPGELPGVALARRTLGKQVGTRLSH